MAVYILRRLLLTLVNAFGVVLVVFVLLRVLPGDPAVAILGEHATKAAVAQVRADLRLDQPILIQFGRFVGELLQGDLGKSLLTRRSVSGDVLAALPHSIRLSVSAVAISVLIGMPLGIVSAQRRNSRLDHASRMAALLFVSAPEFVIAIILLLAFSLYLNWFPATGTGRGAVDVWWHMVLPALTVGLHYAAIMARMTRSTVLEVLYSEYIRTARSKGLAERVVFYKHALRNAMIPVITIIGLNMGRLLGATVVVERVFARDGLGSLLVGTLSARDYAMVQGVIIVFALAVSLVNLAVDVTYAWIDPRIRFS